MEQSQMSHEGYDEKFKRFAVVIESNTPRRSRARARARIRWYACTHLLWSDEPVKPGSKSKGYLSSFFVFPSEFVRRLKSTASASSTPPTAIPPSRSRRLPTGPACVGIATASVAKTNNPLIIFLCLCLRAGKTSLPRLAGFEPATFLAKKNQI